MRTTVIKMLIKTATYPAQSQASDLPCLVMAK